MARHGRPWSGDVTPATRRSRRSREDLSGEDPKRAVPSGVLLGPYIVAGRNCRVQRCLLGCGGSVDPHVHVSAEDPSRVRELPPPPEVVGLAVELAWEFEDSGPPLQPCAHSVGLRLDVYDDDREPGDPASRLAVCVRCHPATPEGP